MNIILRELSQTLWQVKLYVLRESIQISTDWELSQIGLTLTQGKFTLQSDDIHVNGWLTVILETHDISYFG